MEANSNSKSTQTGTEEAEVSEESVMSFTVSHLKPRLQVMSPPSHQPEGHGNRELCYFI